MSQPFATIITGNPQLDRIQANVTNAFNSLNGPFVGGQFIQNVNVGTSATPINHGLGRTPVLWVILDQNTNTTVARTSWNKTTISLKAGSSCTVSIWVN